MQKFIEKARIIMEALPYIKEFYGKTIVVKYGGSAMDDDYLKSKCIEDFVLLRLIGINLIIVHGGGPHITNLMNKLGKEAVFIEGYRYTDKETIEITEMVLSGLINKELVALINNQGGKAVGLSGKDSNLIVAEKKLDKSGKNIDFGLVGNIKKINPELLFTLLKDGYTPVISPIGIGEDGHTYNINADVAASEIAIASKAYRLIYLTDVKGIYRNINDENTFIPTLKKDDVPAMKKDGIITKGMLPKIDSSIKALESGVEKVHIIDGRIEHSVLLELLTEAGIGTEIVL
ncbi:MAG: acetylglutamate kinase [Brevinematales bacterium]|nr:acetylglutamate kinase [Brevinematales bacterium]